MSYQLPPRDRGAKIRVFVTVALMILAVASGLVYVGLPR